MDAEVDARFGDDGVPAGPDLTPVSASDRSGNKLRPTSLNDVIGQERVKALLRRMIDAALQRGAVLDHVLLTGPAGTGKTTLASVIAEELGTDCYQFEAPLSQEMLLAIAEVAQARDVIFLDEIHQQAQQDRRGRSTHMSPETLYHVLEDRRLVTAEGVLPFPAVTFIGATTDMGMLPQPFLRRFPLKPRLAAYTVTDLAAIARMNAERLEVALTPPAATIFARAAGGFPWMVNTFMRNARSLTVDGIDEQLARDVVTEVNSMTLDGLTLDQQRMLMFLAQHGRRETKDGDVTYKASVSTLATALGHARDVKAIQQYVEPALIERGLIQVGHGGRLLTDKGIERAEELRGEGDA